MNKGIAGVAFAVAALCAWTGSTTTVSAQTDAGQNKTLFTVVVNQIFNAGDIALVDGLVAKDVTDNGSALGRDGFKSMVKDLRAKNPSFQMKVDDLVAQDDKVIGRVTETGSGGTESRIVILRIADGQVTEHWNMPDAPALRHQFGLTAGAAGASVN
jgi:predicted ester cyclase